MDDETAYRLKSEWTGRRVAVRPDRPALLRFAGKAGRVVTVNMNGRALVQFDRSPNTGWFDIDVADLAEVEPTPVPTAGSVPPPGPAAPPDNSYIPSPGSSTPRPTASATSPAKESILERARRQGAAKPRT